MVLGGDDYSGGSGSGEGDHDRNRPMKRQRERKIPQRGLGVAQLERMRLEEQKPNAAKSSSSCRIMNSPPLTLPNRSSSRFPLESCPPFLIPTAPSMRNNYFGQYHSVPAITSQQPLGNNKLLDSTGNSSLASPPYGISLRMEPPSNQNSGPNPDHQKIGTFGGMHPRSLSFQNLEENGAPLFRFPNSMQTNTLTKEAVTSINSEYVISNEPKSCKDLLSWPSTSASSYSKSTPVHREEFSKGGRKLYCNEKPPFYTFFPLKEEVKERTSEERKGRNASYDLDLNLKL